MFGGQPSPAESAYSTRRIILLQTARGIYVVANGAASHIGGMAKRAPTPASVPALQVFQSAEDQEWFAITQDIAALPAALGPWFPAAGQNVPLATNPLERERIDEVISAAGFYLFRVPESE